MTNRAPVLAAFGGFSLFVAICLLGAWLAFGLQ